MGTEGWAPQKSWTAWPMREDVVPAEDFMSHRADDGDEDDAFVFRSRKQEMPSTGLEEELSATMLRIAKERFRRRDLRASPAAEEEEEEPSSPQAIKPSIESGDELPVRIKVSSSQDESDGGGGAPLDSRGRKRQRRDSPTFLPVISADDDISYELLRPAARNIIGNLDAALTILHNVRAAGLNRLSDPSGSDGEKSASGDAAAAAAAARRGKRERPGRERSRPTRRRRPVPLRERRAGRPRRAHAPRDGETEQEMRVRVAREQKKRIPVFSDDDEGESTGPEAKPRRPRSGRRRSSRGKSVPRSGRSADGRGEDWHREKKLANWGLRDWRDVVGAAALAGFSPTVVARATQRCANLFHQQMEIRTLVEEQAGPASGDREETARYIPGNPVVSSSDEETDATEEMDRVRAASRHSSVKPGAASSSEEEFGQRRARRGSVVSTVALSFCHRRGCPRAVDGFGRRDNLVRHLWLVHGERDPAAAAARDEDSADEMDGAVHVDGFLKPIKARTGWRGADAVRRTRSRKSRRRAGESGESDDGYRAEFSDDIVKTEPEEP